MRLKPPSLENRPSVSERIGRFFSGVVDIEVTLEAIGFLLTPLIGLGLLGYVCFMWLLHLSRNGQFLFAGLLGTVFIAVGFAAIARSYLAMAVVLGASAIFGVAFLSGASHAFLP